MDKRLFDNDRTLDLICMGRVAVDFYADKNDQIITISPLKKFKYFIDLKNKEKLLNISGKLFDIDYNFKWKKDYLNPKISNNNIKLKNPDIKIFNQIENRKIQILFDI